MGLIELVVVIILICLIFQYLPLEQPYKNILILVILLVVLVRLFGFIDIPVRFGRY